MKLGSRIGIFVCLCEEDIEWLPQFQKQVEILGYGVAWYADHLSPESLAKLELFPLTVGLIDSQGVFDERSKERAFKLLKGSSERSSSERSSSERSSYDWAIQMDIDETWEENAKELIERSCESNPDGYVAEVPMITVFKENNTLYKREDEYFKTGVESKRSRIYNLKYEWHWNDAITCGAYVFDRGVSKNDLKAFPCLASSVHWGYWTPELMEKKKLKWDRVYTKAFGRNPYPHVYEKWINGNVKPEKSILEERYYKHLDLKLWQ